MKNKIIYPTKLQRSWTLLIIVMLMNVSIPSFAQAPNWLWARSGGSISNDYSNATCTDANGNVYITGTFQGSTITFGSYTLQNVTAGTLDIFIAKYDATGNVLWAESGGGTRDDYAYGIAADVNGNVYITGYFRSPSIMFGTITLTHSDSTGIYDDIFIAKYDSAGNVLWAKSAGSKVSWERSYGICTDTDSNVYITGMYVSSTPVIFGSDTLINRGGYDIFIAKYDAGGNLLWAKSEGGTSYDFGIGICFDISGHFYLTGYQYQAVFGNDTLTGNGLSVFVAKYDTSGNILWAKNALGPNVFSFSVGTGITTFSGSNVYITGFFRYSVSFGNDTLSNAGTDGIFIARYDSSGNALWGRSPGGTNYDYSNSICTDANGNAFVTGYFASSFLNFGGIPVLNANAGFLDVFVAQYDSSGNALWAKSIGGQDYDYGMGISSNAIGDVYLTGYFGSYSLNFGSTTVTNNGSYDIFLAKLSSLVGINEAENFDNNILIFPNPTTNEIRIQNTEGRIESVEVWDVMGELCLRALTPSPSPGGEGGASIDV
ncbi:MAG TPA: hypothetical protein VI757_09360, partial [Bacteroidia bacterium]|nr:hypothetical protein [Bacteroidia bacterium]